MPGNTSVRKNADQVSRYAATFSAMETEVRLQVMQLLLSAHPEDLVVGEVQKELRHSSFDPFSSVGEAEEPGPCRCSARIRSYGTPPIPMLFKNCCSSFTRSAVREIKLLYRRISFRFANRRMTMGATDLKEAVKEKNGQAALRVKTAETPIVELRQPPVRRP